MKRRMLCLLMISLFAVPICAWGFSIKPFSLSFEENLENVAKIEVADPIVKFLHENDIQRIEDYFQWIEKGLDYRKDLARDYWSHPFETIKRGYGDCEDLAFLHQAVLQHFGYGSKVFAFGRGNTAHAFTVFRHEGKLNFFDNNQYFSSQATSFKQIALFIIGYNKAQYLIELEFPNHTMTPIYISKV